MRILPIIFLIMSISIVFSYEQIYANSDPILITHSNGINNVIFDGKWTDKTEWKQSSHNMFSYDDGMVIHLRTAHHEDFIYVFVDPINDETLDDKMDQATICFDGKNNKNEIPDNDDYCFSISLGQKQGILKQGSGNENFKIIDSEEFIAISSVSDENDRYTITPHPSYEFKIPIEMLNRSDNYGFYLSVYDASLDKFYSWPENSTRENSSDIPPPSKWGDIISPDKSLPELNLPILIFGILIFTIILVQSKTKIGVLR